MIDFLRLPFLEAIAYFRDKVSIPTTRWDEFTAEQHDRAFTISQLTKANLLEDARKIIKDAIANGTDIEDFKKTFKQKIVDKGWSPKPLPAGPPDYRLRIMLETNIRRAHTAGRDEQSRSPEFIARRPWRVWRHGDTNNPRATHLALDGKAIRADDPFWEVATPSCAFGCQCDFFTANERQLSLMGAEILANPPDPYTIAEPGFQRTPGRDAARDREELVDSALENLSPDIANKVQNDG